MKKLLVLLVAGCGTTPSPAVSPLPPAPPADIKAACVLPAPEIGRTWRDTAIDNRVALVECKGAAEINYRAWRNIAKESG